MSGIRRRNATFGPLLDAYLDSLAEEVAKMADAIALARKERGGQGEIQGFASEAAARVAPREMPTPAGLAQHTRGAVRSSMLMNNSRFAWRLADLVGFDLTGRLAPGGGRSGVRAVFVSTGISYPGQAVAFTNYGPTRVRVETGAWPRPGEQAWVSTEEERSVTSVMPPPGELRQRIGVFGSDLDVDARTALVLLTFELSTSEAS